MIALSAGQISAIVGGTLRGDESTVVTGVETDSRLIKKGFLFVAKPGEVTDGHLFVGSAVDNGATIALVQRFVESEITQIQVEDVVAALGLLATEVIRLVREHGDLKVIGVTGSNGKTSTKNMLRAILSEFGETVAPRESFNNEVGAPISMLLCEHSTKYLVVELGADGLGSIDYLAKICKPDIAVELKVGMAHAGEWGGIETTAKIKAELVSNLRDGGVLVFNADDSYCAEMAQNFSGKSVGFGTSNTDYRFDQIDFSLSGTSAVLHYPDESALPVNLQILGEHQLYNAAASIAVADQLNLDRNIALAALGRLPLAERWRMQLKEVDGVAIINDAYNASPESMKAALQALAHLARREGRRSVAVLGEMAELGEFSVAEHDAIGRIVVRLNIDQLVVVGEGAKLIHMGASQEGSWDGESKFFRRIDEALEHLRGMLRAGDIVLVKSSKSADLRHLGDALMGVES
ncbi:MAG: hypothetical protein RLZZ400_736 [Actinomycetota bacterium]|jgi:UDP-N-acetylmuramoyl-tripeptide--D-alanyl-D-alanine ligase